jgi:hypothetical protein
VSGRISRECPGNLERRLEDLLEPAPMHACACAQCAFIGPNRWISNVAGKDAYTWSPSGCDLKLVESYFGSIAVEYVPRIGTEGELWRREQILLQLPAYDTDVDKSNVPGPNHGVEMKKLDEVRLRAAFDVGEVLRCPDFSRPDECEECKLREDGTHWAYCSKVWFDLCACHILTQPPSRMRGGCLSALPNFSHRKRHR